MAARRLISALTLCISVVVARTPIGAQMLPVDSIKPYLSRGNYVFEAVLQGVGVVADSLLPASPETAVAKVRLVFACPREVGNFAGEVVTLAEGGPHAPVGTRSWYFATGWAVGDHVAVKVMRRLDGIDDKLVPQFFDSLRAAVRLDYKDAVQTAARASDSIVVATLGTLQNVMIDLVPPREEHAERWIRLNVTVDSIRGFQRKVVNDSSRFVPGWVPPTDSTRHAGILIPYDVAYNVLGQPQMIAGGRRLLFFERLERRPNVQRLDPSASGFIPNGSGIRPLGDAGLLGSTLAMPTFTLPPLQECPQTSR